MIRLVNPNRLAYQNDVVEKLSDENKFIASGVAKAYVSDSCSWIGDFLYKYPNNTTFNKHIAYISFFSDREIMHQEYGNVSEIYDNFACFSSIDRTKIAESTFELSKKQYGNISARRGSFDEIEYFDVSDKKKLVATDTGTEFTYNHGFWRAPAFNAIGYKAHLDSADNVSLGKAEYYDRFYWGFSWLLSSRVGVKKTVITTPDIWYDLESPNDAMDELEYHIFSASTTNGVFVPPTDLKRMLDVKVNVANAKYSYFLESPEWINYYNDTQHYADLKYLPYYGFVNFYQNVKDYNGNLLETSMWEEISPMTNQYGDITFYPQIIHNNKFEPAKIVASWMKYANHYIAPAGQMTYNPCVNENEQTDQSRVVYNISRHMLSLASGEPFFPANYTSAFGAPFIVYKKDSVGNYIYCGVDVDTERNRRYSAVVTTEPYLATEPLGRSEIVEYMFVNKFGNPIVFNGNESSFLEAPDMFLKIKSSKSMIFEIDRELEKNDYNTDIINTLTIPFPTNQTDKLAGHDSTKTYYGTFAHDADPSIFFKRQDDCVDNLIGKNSGDLAIIGQGYHNVFYIDSTGFSFDDLYTSGAIVNGLGFVSKITNGVVTNYLNAYCSNYNPISAPLKGTTASPENTKSKLVTNGMVWVSQTMLSAGWRDVAISSDSMIQMAVEYYGGVWLSYDYGENWAKFSQPPIINREPYSTCAMSADGKYMLAGGSSGDDGNSPDILAISKDSGLNWVSTEITTGTITDISFNHAANTMTRVSGSFITDGFTKDLPINIGISSSTLNNMQITASLILNITDKVITINPVPKLVFTDMAAGEPATITQMVYRWKGCAVSNSGQYMTACANNASHGGLYVSKDFGVTWKLKIGGDCIDVCMSANGQYQYMIVKYRLAYKSADWGENWIKVDSINRAYTCCSISGDGKHVTFGIKNSGIRHSGDFGVSFANAIINSPGVHDYTSVSSSYDGSRQAIVTLNKVPSTNGYGTVYVSIDNGSTWNPQVGTNINNWWGVSVSSDGTIITAVGESTSITRRIEAPIYAANIVSEINTYEKFKPMLKLSGINGYVKIMERSMSFPIKRSDDGKFETIYHVEFPYCPGSFTERKLMNFKDSDGNAEFKKTWVLKKSAYINAGSWQKFSDDKYDIGNNRYAPMADDSFCPHVVLTQAAKDGVTRTKSEKNGGGAAGYYDTQLDLVEYPSSLVWTQNAFNLLSLTKCRIHDYRRYGTYDIRLLPDMGDDIEFKKDVKLVGMVDNRKWRFSSNRFVSYINRENPSYICEMDVAALFEDYTAYQKNHAVIPDIKRWIYSQFSGFAHTLATPDYTSEIDDKTPGYTFDIVTETNNTIKNDTLVSEDSYSDIVIEVWDSKSDLGNSIVSGNWRPFSPINSDSEKLPGKILLSNLFVAKGSLDIPSTIQSDLYEALIGYAVGANTQWPEWTHIGNGVENSDPSMNDILHGKQNLVLFNSQSERTYHIAYIEAVVADGVNYYKAYIHYHPGDSAIPVFDPKNFDVGDPAAFQICLPKKQINKDISFKLYTSEITQPETKYFRSQKFIIKYIDILSDLESPSDFERYVSEDKKIFFRVRILKKKNYPITYENKDVSKIQYLWTAADVAGKRNDSYINDPWWDRLAKPPVHYTVFDWTKIKTEEAIKKLGMTYFKIASR